MPWRILNDMPTKCMLILLDGLGDRAYPQFNNRTPLQAATTPCLDGLAQMGASGSYHASRQGEALPSENAHFAIFGYESEYFPGRGPLEAIGAGIDLDGKDVAVLAHFASLEEKGDTLVLKNGKLDLGQGAVDQLVQQVASYAYEGIRLNFHHTHKAYGIITLHGQVSPYFTDTDPVVAGMPLIEPRPLQGYETDNAVIATATALKKYLLHVYRLLQSSRLKGAAGPNDDPRVDGLVTQRAGQLKPVMTFGQRYGLKGLSMASGFVYHGLSRFLGMDFVKVADGADPGEDLARRVKDAHRSLADYDFVHVHTKVPDEAGHTKDPLKKKAVIESLDAGLARVIQPVLDDQDVLLVITADHSTPSAGPLIHSGEPVPLLFCGAGVRRDDVRVYDEVASVQGALGQVRARELILMVLNALDRAKLQGLMDTPVNQPYWPGSYERFSLI